MMTVWVVLHQLPLTFQASGPCLIVSAHDVALYDYDVATGQSNARIVLGEKICEGTLLRGLLVHSAGDYSQLLQSIIGWSPATFVRVMNADARKMGLTRTHYVDLTGISPGDQSTAGEQATLAVNLMTDEPIVDQIVALTHVAPVSYTHLALIAAVRTVRESAVHREFGDIGEGVVETLLTDGEIEQSNPGNIEQHSPARQAIQPSRRGGVATFSATTHLRRQLL